MSAYSSRLFRAAEYRSRLQRFAVAGPSHAAYLSAHPDETTERICRLNELEKGLASADIEGYDREALLRELESYRKSLHRSPESADGLSSLLTPTWRDVVVAAVSAYTVCKGRDWFEQKLKELNRKQAEYIAEEMGRVK